LKNEKVKAIQRPKIIQESFSEGEEEENKTPICKFYLVGKCNKGSFCPFSHVKTKKKDFDEKKFLNEKYLPILSNIPCKYFQDNGDCPFGQHCYYFHEE
jgi:hypothetical protein